VSEHIQSRSVTYDDHFFDDLRQGSRRSAEVIVPLILDWFKPRSVVDVGCGDGTWLSVFVANGVTDVLGIDGSYVSVESLQISPEYFIAKDLKKAILLERTFDLVLSLEVAEHLPEDCADRFAKSLTRLGSLVLFSAAIPHQGGTHHVNEQWPSYWIQKFRHHGYKVIDAMRSHLWDNPNVEPWYAQNSLLFVHSDRFSDYLSFCSTRTHSQWLGQSLIHPNIYLTHCSTPKSESSKTVGQANTTESEPSRIVQIVALSFSPSAEIQNGEALTIEFEYLVTDSVESAIFSLSLSSADGQIFLDVDTIVSELSDHLEKQNSIKLHIERLDLAEGTYFLNPGIFSSDWQETYDFQWHCYPITVHASLPSQKSILNPPMHWHIATNV